MVQLATVKGIRFMEVSAKTNFNIDEVGIIYLFTHSIPKNSLQYAL